MEITKWEYKKVGLTDPNIDFNELGKQGWEAVCGAGLIVFKRPIGCIQVKEIRHEAKQVQAQTVEDFTGQLDQALQNVKEQDEDVDIEM